MSSLDCSIEPSESGDTFNCELSSDNKLCNTDNIGVINNVVINEMCDADKTQNQLSDGTAQDICEKNNLDTRKSTIDGSVGICISKELLRVNNDDENSDLFQNTAVKLAVAESEEINIETSFMNNNSDSSDRIHSIEIKDKQEISDASESISAIVNDFHCHNDKLEPEIVIIHTNVSKCDENQAENCEKSDSVQNSVIIEAKSKQVYEEREHNTNDITVKGEKEQDCKSETSHEAKEMHNQCSSKQEILKIVETENISDNNTDEREKNETVNKDKQGIKKDVLIQSDDGRVALKNIPCLESLASDKTEVSVVSVVKDSVLSDSKPEDSQGKLKSCSMDTSPRFKNGDGDQNKLMDVPGKHNILVTAKVSDAKMFSEQRHDESLETSASSSDKRSEGDVIKDNRSRHQRVSKDVSPKKDSTEISGDHCSLRDRSSDKYRSRERSRSRKRSRSRDQSRSFRDQSYRRRRNSRSRSNERRDRDTRDRQRKSPYGRSDRDTKRKSRSPSDSEYSRRNRPWTERRASDHCVEKVFDLRDKISRTRMNSNGIEVHDETNKSLRSSMDVTVEQSRRMSSRGEEATRGPSFSRSREDIHRENLRDFDAKKVNLDEKYVEKGPSEFRWRGNRDEVPINSERNARQFDYGRSGGNRDRSETDRRQDRRRERERSVENRGRIDRRDGDKKLEDIVGESIARIRRSGEDSFFENSGANGQNKETPRHALSNDISSKNDGRENGNKGANKVDNTNSAIHVVLSQTGVPPNRFKPLDDSFDRKRNSTIEIITDNDKDDKAIPRTMNQSVVVNIHEPPPNVNILEPPPNFFSGPFGAVTRHALPEPSQFCTPPPGFDQIPGQFPRGASMVHQLPVGVQFEHLVTHHQLVRAPPSRVLLRGQPPDVCLERPGAEFRLAAPPSSGQQQQQVRMEWRVVNPQEMMTLHRFPAPQFFRPGSIHNGPGGQGLIRTGMGPNDLIPVSMQPQLMTLQPGHQFTPTSMGTILRLDGSMQHVVSSADGNQMVQLGMLMNRPPLMSVGPHLSSHLARMQQPPPMQGISAIPLPTRAMMYLNPSETMNLSTLAAHSNPSPVLNSTLTPMLRSVQPTSGASYPMERHGQPHPVAPLPPHNESNPPPPPPSSLTKPNSYWSISPVEMSESEEEEEGDNLSDEDHEEPVTIYRNDSAADFAANVSSKQWHGSSQTGAGCGMPAREPIPSARLVGSNKPTCNVKAKNKHASDSVSSDNSSDVDEIKDRDIKQPSTNDFSKTTSCAATPDFAQCGVRQQPRFTSAGFNRVDTNVERISIDDSQSSLDSVKIIRAPVSVKLPASVQRPPSLTKPVVPHIETLDDSMSSDDSDNAAAAPGPPPPNFPPWSLLGKHHTLTTGAGEVTRAPAADVANIVPAAEKTKQTEEKLSEISDKTKKEKEKEIMDRVVEEVKTALKPYYAKLSITKDEYKDIMRRAVPKICRSTKCDVLPAKIQEFIDQYVAKVTHRSGGKKQRESASRTGAGHTGKPPHHSSKTN